MSDSIHKHTVDKVSVTQEHSVFTWNSRFKVTTPKIAVLQNRVNPDVHGMSDSRNTIIFKRGLKTRMPTLSLAEPSFCTDTQELYIGNGVTAKRYGPTDANFTNTLKAKLEGLPTAQQLQEMLDDITPGTLEDPNINGDRLLIDWNPTNYSPRLVTQTTLYRHLSSHLKGIDVSLSLINSGISDINSELSSRISGVTVSTPLSVSGTSVRNISIPAATTTQHGYATSTQITKLGGIEEGADVTDSTNVDAAGAVMESDYNANSILVAHTDNTPTSLEIGELTVVGRKSGESISAVSIADIKSALVIKVSDDTAPQLGGDLDLNQKGIICDPTPNANYGWNGVAWPGVAGENLVAGNLCYYKSDGKYWKTDATAEATSKGLIVLATQTITTNSTGVFLRKGFFRNDTWGLDTANQLYISGSVVGSITQFPPTTKGYIVRIVGYVMSATSIWFEPDSLYMEL